MTPHDDLIRRARDKTRLRKTHGLTGWVLAEEALTDELADALERQQRDLTLLTAERDRLREAVLEGIANLKEHKGYEGVIDYMNAAIAEQELARSMSCFLCGQQCDAFAVWHSVYRNVGVCFRCRDAAQSALVGVLSPAQKQAIEIANSIPETP